MFRYRHRREKTPCTHTSVQDKLPDELPSPSHVGPLLAAYPGRRIHATYPYCTRDSAQSVRSPLLCAWGGQHDRWPPHTWQCQARWAPGWPFWTTKEASTTAGEAVSEADATTR